RHAGPNVDLVQALRDARSRFEHGRSGEIASRRQLMHEVSRKTEEVREGACVREAGFGVVGRTEIRSPFAAAGTVTAGAKALGDDDGSFGDPMDAPPNRFDRPRPFVAGDDRVAHVPGRAPAVEHLDVRTADACGADANEDFARTRLGP